MSSNIVELNAANWEKEVVKSERLVVVEFWHTQCPYCRILEPIYAKLAEDYSGKLKFAKLNVLESQHNQELAGRYGIMGTPTLKFFCGGRPVQDIVGVLTEEYLHQGVEFALKKHKDCLEKSTPLKLSYID
ncbi:MAG: thioredoxin [Candidatus Bathyarchaeota archaeon]|nr:MAG: thioredoxin [Candidatus Bathyarchaeota archaeon]